MFMQLCKCIEEHVILSSAKSGFNLHKILILCTTYLFPKILNGSLYNMSMSTVYKHSSMNTIVCSPDNLNGNSEDLNMKQYLKLFHWNFEYGRLPRQLISIYIFYLNKMFWRLLPFIFMNNLFVKSRIHCFLL